ncbi:MAG: hypothetical protein F4057_09190, partial [Acidobacteria bacterium]|nr:hypothetical protein [Acidobacteriota bacterium]
MAVGSSTGLRRRLVLAVGTVACCAMPLAAQQAAEPIEWRYVGGDQAHTKYSRADEITAANVDRLEIAWQWDPREMPLPDLGARPG